MKTTRVLLCLIGASIAGYGVSGLLTAASPDLVHYLGFMLVGVAAHDLVLAPVSLGVGALLARRLSPGSRWAVLAGLFVSLAVTLIALPFALGYGKRPDDPSALPLDYGRGLMITLGGVWIGVLTVALARFGSRRIRPPSGSGWKPPSGGGGWGRLRKATNPTATSRMDDLQPRDPAR